MKDYANFPSSPPPGTGGRSRKPLFLLGALLLLALAVALIARHTLRRLATEEAVVLRAENASVAEIAPPLPEDYQFYSQLTAEKPLRLDEGRPKDAEQQPAAVPGSRFYILVEYFPVYAEASRRAREIKDLGMGDAIPIKTEPYLRDGTLVFRIRVGPYASRSAMNGARDNLYRVEIPHRILTDF